LSGTGINSKTILHGEKLAITAWAMHDLPLVFEHYYLCISNMLEQYVVEYNAAM
jgi:hypothetical protein